MTSDFAHGCDILLNKSTSTGLHFFIATHLAGAQGIFMGLASQTELGAISYQKRVLQNQIIGETRAVAANPRPRTSIEMGVDVDGSCMDEGGERTI